VKKLCLLMLLGVGATALAQAPKPEAAALPADEAATRAELEKARERLDTAAREVAELSRKLGGAEVHRQKFVFVDGSPEGRGGPRRAILGVQIDPDSGKEGAKVRSVSPGGPAAEAGLRDGDLIVALDGKSLTGSSDSGRALVERMRDVKPEQKVKVKVLRDGKPRDLTVVARARVMERGERAFNIRVPEPGHFGPAGPNVRWLGRFGGEFGGMELANLTPKLGAYFGADSGVLVVKAPDSDAFKLEDGDVIQTIDGRKPEGGAHALRILRSYQSGEKVTFAVLRQRKPVSLQVTMPEAADHFMHMEPGMPMPVPMPPPTGMEHGDGPWVLPLPEGAATGTAE
jgi:S1-C subfamily serine protease